MVKRKLNLKRVGIFCGIVLLIIILSIIGIKKLIEENKLRQTTEYKLESIGYTTNEIKVILNSLDNKKVEDILNSTYKKHLTKFLKEKYFIYENLERYLNYYNDNLSVDPNYVVGIVNSNADKDWYEGIVETDTSKGVLMLVNKFNKLPETYVPEELIKISSTYAYSGKYVSKVIYDDLTDMLDSAREEGYTLVVSQGYRSYMDQSEAYKEIEDSSGTGAADDLAARAGHSDYQTGLSVIVTPYNKIVEDVSTSLEHIWLINNAHQYGFILRYPEGKEKITGFNKDDWRLRYVGVDAAMKIHNENITFDEYYAYYINN